MGGYFDALMLAQQDRLDQEAAQAKQDASVRAHDKASIAPVPAYREHGLGLHSFPNMGGAGGGAAGGGFAVYSDQVASVASSMGTTDVNTIEDGQTKLNNGGPFGLISTAGWMTADNLASNFGIAYQAVSTYMQDLLNVYHQTVTALRKNAANYDDADSTSAADANRVGGEV